VIWRFHVNYNSHADAVGDRMCGMRWFLSVWMLAATVAAVAQPVPTINLKGSLEIVDATSDTTPVSAISVALYSPSTFAMYRAQPDQNGTFELKGIRPGHYVLEMGMPSRLRTFIIGGRESSPAGFELMAGEKGPMRIVLSVKTGDMRARLVAILAPDDEFLTLHSQVTNPVSAGTTQFRFQPPGKYLLFIVDTEFSRELGTDTKLRDALKERATRVEILPEINTRVSASYIDRQIVEEARRQIAPR
jgi:hypothetical protein